MNRKMLYNQLDKLKFKTNIKNLLSEGDVMKLGYEPQTFKHNNLKNYGNRPYLNEKNHVSIIWDNFYLKIEFNPTIYIHGHNVTMCSLSECIIAIESLGNELGVVLWNWSITGYDWNVTINVDYPCSAYLPLLQEHAKYKRMTSETNTGKTYENKCRNRTLIAYNKLEQIKKKKVIIPPSLEGQNLFRLEHSIVNKLQQYEVFKDVETLKDFLIPTHWNNAANLFLITYGEIRKHQITDENIKYLTPDHFSTTQKGKLHDILLSGSIEDYIIDQQIIEGKGTISLRGFKARIKEARRIWNAYIDYSRKAENGLLYELNDKVYREVDRLKIK